MSIISTLREGNPRPLAESSAKPAEIGAAIPDGVDTETVRVLLWGILDQIVERPDPTRQLSLSSIAKALDVDSDSEAFETAVHLLGSLGLAYASHRSTTADVVSLSATPRGIGHYVRDGRPEVAT